MKWIGPYLSECKREEWKARIGRKFSKFEEKVDDAHEGYDEINQTERGLSPKELKCDDEVVKRAFF